MKLNRRPIVNPEDTHPATPVTVTPKKQNRGPLAVVGIMVFFVLGLIIGGASAGGTKTVTETVDRNVTPQSCIDFTNYADQGFDLASQSIGLGGQGVSAALNKDFATLSALTDQMKSLNTQMDTLKPDLLAAKADCRASK